MVPTPLSLNRKGDGGGKKVLLLASCIFAAQMQDQSLAPGIYYRQELKHTADLYIKLQATMRTVSRGRIVSAVAALVAIWYAVAGNLTGWVPVGGMVLFLLLVRRHIYLGEQQKLLQTRLHIIENELIALDGFYTQFATGAELISSAHPYSLDLDVFGKGSVFQLLCRSITAQGYQLLASWLKVSPTDAKEIEERQAITKELGGAPELLLELRTAGAGIKEQEQDKARLESWLRAVPEYMNNKLIVGLAIVLPAASIIGMILSVMSGGVHGVLLLAIFVNGVIWGVLQKKIKQTDVQVARSAAFVEKYEGLIRIVAGYEAKQEKLKEIVAQAAQSVQQAGRFRKLVELFNSRNNGMVGPLMNLLFLYDLFNIIRLERWRKEHKDLLLQAIDHVVLMDAYVSCATYVFNNPGYCYPGFAEGKSIRAVNMRHPLLPAHTAVGNELNIGKDESIYLLTGANMTGKSTFMRTLGVNVVLAHMGLPVAADEMTLPVLRVYTSMRITDSVQDDISYFKAELQRIQNMMATIAGSDEHYLVLLDEPLRGTNSQDKQSGTRAIINRLLREHVISIVATHDTGLGDMAETTAGQVANYHFESKVAERGLSFDFKLRKGISTSNNATILMQQMGIIT